MANSKIPYINLNTSINEWRVRTNHLLDSVGDISTLSTGYMTVVGAINSHDSDIGNREDLNTDWFKNHATYSSSLPATIDSMGQASIIAAINEVDFRIDSANDNQINSPKLFMSDSSANNTIKGNLFIHSNVDIGGTLTVDGVVNFKAGSAGSVTLGDANTDNVVFNADINSHLIPNTDSAYDLGSASQQWRNLYIDGVGFIDNIQADNVNVSGLTTLNGDVDIGNATTDTVSITARIDTDLVPSTDNASSLGSSSLEFKHLYLDGTAFVDDVTADSATIGTMKVTDLTDNRVVIAGTGGEIEDDANFTFNGTQLNIGTGNFTVQQASGNVYAAGELTVGDSAEFRNNVVVDGNLNVGGNTTLQGTLVVDGQVTFKAGANNDIALGDASTDTVTINAEVKSNIVPDADRTYNLGSSSNEWKDLFVDGIGYIDEVNADSATIGILDVTNRLNVSKIITDSSANYLTITNTSGILLGDSAQGIFGRIYTARGNKGKLSFADSSGTAIFGIGTAGGSSFKAYKAIYTDSALSTTAQTVAGGINEILTKQGSVAALSTTATTVVTAINELFTSISALDSDATVLSASISTQIEGYTGLLSNLNTTEKGTLVGAINEIDGRLIDVYDQSGTLLN